MVNTKADLLPRGRVEIDKDTTETIGLTCMPNLRCHCTTPQNSLACCYRGRAGEEPRPRIFNSIEHPNRAAMMIKFDFHASGDASATSSHPEAVAEESEQAYMDAPIGQCQGLWRELPSESCLQVVSSHHSRPQASSTVSTTCGVYAVHGGRQVAIRADRV